MTRRLARRLDACASGLTPARTRAAVAAVAGLLALCGLAPAAAAGAQPPLVAAGERTPEFRFVPAGGGEGGQFGASVALSQDGATALVGAPGEGHGLGQAWVYARSSRSGWEAAGTELSIPAAASEHCGQESAEEAQEEGSSGEEEPNPCHFGQSVALSGDGGTAVVGSSHADGNGGAVWVFSRSPAGWTQTAEIVGPGERTRFGRSVALSGDGDTLLVGAPMYKGRAWVYTRGADGWELAGALSGSGREGEGGFGHSVALSADGEVAVVGAPGSDGGGTAWVFERSSSGWPAAGSRLSGSAESSEQDFGRSVALSGDGSTALVGAPGDEGGAGAVWMFGDGATGWGAGTAIAGGEPGEELGSALALSEGGGTALVGAAGARSGRGRAWLFEGLGEGWGAPLARLGAGTLQSATAHFGSSVALAQGAEAMLVGGRSESRVGAAWAFGPAPSVEAVDPDSGPSAGGTTVKITGEHLAHTEQVLFGSNTAASFTIDSEKEITAVTPRGMGKVSVTVTTPLGESALNENAYFTYKSKASEGGGEGGEGKGKAGKGGEGKGEAPGGQSSPAATGAGVQAVSSVLASGPTAASGCSVSLSGRKLTVKRGRARLVLARAGVARCAGRLRLTARVRRGHGRRGSKNVRIGAASFAIAAGRTVTVQLRLNAAGRALLRERHGKLGAKLVLVRLSPAPVQARTAGVRLVRARKRGR